MQLLLAILAIAAVVAGQPFWMDPPRTRFSPPPFPPFRTISFSFPPPFINQRVRPMFPRYPYQYSRFRPFRPFRPWIRFPFRPFVNIFRPPILMGLPYVAVREYNNLQNNKSLTLAEAREKLFSWAKKYNRESFVKEIKKEYREKRDKDAKALFEKMPQAFAKYRALFDSSKTIGQVIKDRFRFAVDYPDEYNLIQTVYRMLRRRIGHRSRITPVKSTPALKTTTRPLATRTVESFGRKASSGVFEKKKVIEEAGKRRRAKVPKKKASETDDDEDED